MKTYLFPIIIEEDKFEDGRMAYHVYCPVLKGASTWGYTQDEAIKNINEVVRLTVESMIEHGEELPLESEKKVIISTDPLVAVTI